MGKIDRNNKKNSRFSCELYNNYFGIFVKYQNIWDIVVKSILK